MAQLARRVGPVIALALAGAGCGVAAGTSTVRPSQTIPPPPAALAPAAAGTRTSPPAPTTLPAPTALPAPNGASDSAPAAAPSNAAAPAAGGPDASRPCGVTAAAPGYDHVVWIVIENRGFGDVVGSPAAPYLASVARACGLATGYSGVAHPSLPNYLAMTSGSTHGVSDDANPSSHPINGPSIFSLLGGDWRSLQESMPANCARAGAGEYAVKHNPAAYYTSLTAACAVQDVPLAASPDISARFTLLTPNLCHDMHDCSTAAGDGWLASEMPLLLNSPTYRAGHTAIFITWDENDSGGAVVPTYVLAPSVRPGTQVSAAFTHYSLLRTTEELLGLSPLLGAAAQAPSMAAPFGL